MPIYEYQCESCGVVEETIQKMSDPGPASCHSCGKGPMVKLMSMTNFALKGSGWYVTDFRDKSSPKKDNHEGGENTGASKTDSKETASKDGASAAKSSDTAAEKTPEKVATESSPKTASTPETKSS